MSFKVCSSDSSKGLEKTGDSFENLKSDSILLSELCKSEYFMFLKLGLSLKFEF